MKFTAWPLAALALFAARDRHGRRAPGRMALGMAVVVVPAVVPFVLQNPHAFVANVFLFPIGLAGVASPAASPLPGHLLVAAFPSLHRVLPLTVATVGGVVLVRHLFRHPPTTAAEASTLAAWIMLVAIVSPRPRGWGTCSTRSTSSCGRRCSRPPTAARWRSSPPPGSWFRDPRAGGHRVTRPSERRPLPKWPRSPGHGRRWPDPPVAPVACHAAWHPRARTRPMRRATSASGGERTNLRLAGACAESTVQGSAGRREREVEP